MKRSELKLIIKECVKEALFEEGVLSEIIAEVAFGLTKAQNIMSESKAPPAPDPKIKQQEEESRRQKILETKKRMLNAIGSEKMSGVFEGTEPLRTSGQETGVPSPLAGRDPGDSGVDISGLFSLAGDKWNILK